MAKSSAELAGADTDVDRIVDEFLRRWGAELAACIAEAQTDGSVVAGDPGLLATLILGQLRGFEVLHKGGVEPTKITASAEQLLALVAAD